MGLSASTLNKIENRYNANRQALAHIKQRIDAIEAENQSLAKLISETPADANSQYLSMQSRKAVEKRNLLIKY